MYMNGRLPGTHNLMLLVKDEKLNGFLSKEIYFKSFLLHSKISLLLWHLQSNLLFISNTPASFKLSA